jgi:hypothetical protein
MISIIRKEAFHQIVGNNQEYFKYSLEDKPFIKDLVKVENYPYYQLDTGEVFAYIEPFKKLLIPKKFNIIEKLEKDPPEFTLSNWNFAKINDQVPYLCSEFHKTEEDSILYLSTYHYNSTRELDEEYSRKIDNIRKSIRSGTYEFHDSWSKDTFQVTLKVEENDWSIRIYSCYPEKKRQHFNSRYAVTMDLLLGSILNCILNVK